MKDIILIIRSICLEIDILSSKIKYQDVHLLYIRFWRTPDLFGLSVCYNFDARFNLNLHISQKPRMHQKSINQSYNRL